MRSSRDDDASGNLHARKVAPRDGHVRKSFPVVRAVVSEIERVKKME